MNQFSYFLQAVDRGDDEETEQIAQQLNVQDEAALLALSRDPSADRRWWGIRGLAQIAASSDPTIHRLNEHTLDGVVAALQDSEPSVRAAAALALAPLHRHTINQSSDTQPLVLPHLARLAEALSDPDGMVRQAATDALAQCGDAAIPILAALLQNKQPIHPTPNMAKAEREQEAVRTRAAMALRRMATLSAAAILFRYLNDPNYLVHTYAHEGLEELGLLDNLLLAV